MQPQGVELEFTRDEDNVVVSARGPEGGFVLVLPLSGSTVFADAAARAAGNSGDCTAESRFLLRKATLEVNHAQSSAIQLRVRSGSG